jgi:uncharacterized membrane protein
MYKTKYGGELNQTEVVEYLDRLVGRVYKLLPIRENSESDFLNNHKSLMEELAGGERLLHGYGIYVELLNKLESLPVLTEHKQFRKSILESIDIIPKIKSEVLKNGEKGQSLP